jgi:hypothetical protein
MAVESEILLGLAALAWIVFCWIGFGLIACQVRMMRLIGRRASLLTPDGWRVSAWPKSGDAEVDAAVYRERVIQISSATRMFAALVVFATIVVLALPPDPPG